MTSNPRNFEVSLRQAIAELERRHSLGETEVCESVLADFPQVMEHRDSVLELIYFEYVLSQDSESPISADELQSRFPEYQDELQKILNVDRAFRNSSDTDALDSKTVPTDLQSGIYSGADALEEFDGFGDYEVLEKIGH